MSIPMTIARSRRSPGTRGPRRGFSLLELMIVVALVAVLGAIAVPFSESYRRSQQLRDASRMLMTNLRSARSAAVSGANLQGFGGVGDVRARVAGIRIDSDSSYLVYVEGGQAALGNVEVVTLRTVSFLADLPGSQLRIAAPAPGSEIRFTSQGRLTDGSPTLVRLEDPSSGLVKEIQISLAGAPRLL